MTDTIDEERSWIEPAMDAEEFRRLLEAVKAALEEHHGPLCSGDLQSLIEAERASSPADFVHLVEPASNDNGTPTEALWP